MVEIGGKPILWHLMKSLSAQGVNDFIICLGYKGYLIKEYFANYWIHTSDIEVSLPRGSIEVLNSGAEEWRVRLIDTGASSQTGERLRRVAPFIESPHFLFTYGDGLADVNVMDLERHHLRSGRKATVTAVRPPGRFGALSIGAEGLVMKMEEKPEGRNSWINGGFFVLSTSILEEIPLGNSIWEKEPLENLAAEAELFAYEHEGFWHPMDTLRDKNHLENLWQSGSAPWKNWK